MIPVISKGFASLRDIFSDPEIPALGGNPMQKIAFTKLLLAIGQSACTPAGTKELDKLDTVTFRSAFLRCLEEKLDRFWLFDEKPFLQMLSIRTLIEQRKQIELKFVHADTVRKKGAAENKVEKNALPRMIGMEFYPDLPAENNTIMNHFQTAETTEPAGKDLIIVTLMNFAFGGKRIEKNREPLSPGFTGKSISAKRRQASAITSVICTHSLLAPPFRTPFCSTCFQRNRSIQTHTGNQDLAYHHES